MMIGIDIGGTKIAAISLSSEGNNLKTISTFVPKNYDQFLRELITIVEQLRKKTGIKEKGIGISLAGNINPNGSIKRAINLPWLTCKPLKSDIKKLLHQEHIYIANDANCFTASEAYDGAAAGSNVVFGVILGTGVGGGLSINNRLITGIYSLSGEWGHIPFPQWKNTILPKIKCTCGEYGCIETFLSGRGLQKIYESLSGNLIDVPQIIEEYSSGEIIAKSALDTYHQRLAEALAMVVKLFDPDIIVLGGGLSQINSIYNNVPKKIQVLLAIDNLNTQIVKAKHGPASGVRGAARLIQTN